MFFKGTNSKAPHRKAITATAGAGPASSRDSNASMRIDSASAAAAARSAAVRTPWGSFTAEPEEQLTRDPFEPDAPLTPAQVAARAAATAGPRLAGGTPVGEQDPAALTPRELFEMLVAPAAQPTRSSPLRTNSAETLPVAAPEDARTVPAEAEMILSALEAGSAAAGAKYADRRGHVRRPFRAQAALRLFSDSSSSAPWTLYTRDIHSRGLGFITPHRLPLGYGGMLEMQNPTDPTKLICLPCTLLRCREAAPGWYEGSLYFNREQPAFDKI